MSDTSAPPDLWESQDDHVPAVNSGDLKKVWQLFSDFQDRNPGQHGAIGNSVYKSVCSPGADVHAVWYRASMLWLLNKTMPEVLAQRTHDGQLDDAVFQVAATFPMEKMQTGVVRNSLPFDAEEFVKQIAAQQWLVHVPEARI